MWIKAEKGGGIVKKTGAVLVAAGLSSRMKAFKPMLPFGDSTISLHVVSVLEKLGIEPIVVVTGHRADELEKHLSCTSVRFVKNEHYRTTQMFDSVKLGINEICGECDRILMMPMDIPAIMMETFRQILMIDADIVRTFYKGQPEHPILLRSNVAENLCKYTGAGGFRGALENSGFPITNVEVEDEAVCWDVDTPQEYQNLLKWNYERGKGYPVYPQVQISLVANEVFFGPGTAQLMHLIDQTGAIQDACSKMGLSYSKGSKMIKAVEDQLGVVIAQRWTGGSGGGGTSLTEDGKRLLKNYQEMIKRVNEATERIYEECFSKTLWG